MFFPTPVVASPPMCSFPQAAVDSSAYTVTPAEQQQQRPDPRKMHDRSLTPISQ